MAWKVTTKPTVEPVTLAEAKAHLKVTYTNEDSLITAMIQAAREEAENYTQLAFVEQTIEESFDRFPSACPNNFFSSLWLSRSPLYDTASLVIKYQDTDNAEQTLATSKYDIDDKVKPGCITPAYNESWPSTANVKNSVTVTYKAGFGTTAADVPQTIKQAMLLMIGNWYEKRSDDPQTPFTRKIGNAQALLDRHRITEFV